MRVFQQCVVQQQPPHSQRSKSSPAHTRVQGRQGHNAAAAAAAAVLFGIACSVAAARADQHVAASQSLGAWSTAALSVARQWLVATSLPNLGVAIFAGGLGTCDTCCQNFAMLIFACCVFWLGNGMVEWAEVCLLIACASLMPCAVDGSGASNAVDIFNATSGAWSTAALSVARAYLAATSLPNLGVAIFAGGGSTCCHVFSRIFACCVVLIGEWDG
jgi:hypothetical protein